MRQVLTHYLFMNGRYMYLLKLHPCNLMLYILLNEHYIVNLGTGIYMF